MGRQRVWLSTCEWSCCGGPISPGDAVEFSVTRGQDDWLTETVGAEFAKSIDAVESHHEDGGQEQVTGIVASIATVATPHRVERVRRPPLPPGVTERARWSIGGESSGVFAGARRTEFMTSMEPVGGPPVLESIRRVPRPPAAEVREELKPIGRESRRPVADAHKGLDAARQASQPAMADQTEDVATNIRNRVVGYLVEIDVAE